MTHPNQHVKGKGERARETELRWREAERGQAEKAYLRELQSKL